MNEQELRALVRDAIARHARGSPTAQAAHVAPRAILSAHPSHGLFAVTEGSEMEGVCIIEPAVTCNHCGFCKSYGH